MYKDENHMYRVSPKKGASSYWHLLLGNTIFAILFIANCKVQFFFAKLTSTLSTLMVKEADFLRGLSLTTLLGWVATSPLTVIFNAF